MLFPGFFYFGISLCTLNSQLLVVLHGIYNKSPNACRDCWVSIKSPVILKAHRAPVYSLRSVKLPFTAKLREFNGYRLFALAEKLDIN